MQNEEYFKLALKDTQTQVYLNIDWVLSCFSVVEFNIWEETEPKDLYKYQLVKKKEEPNKLFTYGVNNDELVELTDYVLDKPLLNYGDRITMISGDVLNLSKTVETNYGSALLNSMVLIYPFGDKIPYQEKGYKGSTIEKIVTANLHDTPKEGETRNPNFFYVDELVKHADAVTSLNALSYTCVPTTSESTMKPNPAVVKRRDELLRQHKNELHKPEVIAAIQAELADIDKKAFENDRANGFYLDEKAYAVVRMKKFGMLGLLGGFGGNPPTLVTTSLSDGLQPEDWTAVADDIRAGSYSRGKSTAVAGADVKLVYNAFQTVKITDNDCGVKTGMDYKITEDNYDQFENLYGIINGKVTLLKTEFVKTLIGKTLVVRSPMICKEKPPLICRYCAGESLAMLPNAVHITASDVNSIYMNNAMKAMHGKIAKTKKFDIFNSN